MDWAIWYSAFHMNNMIFHVGNNHNTGFIQPIYKIYNTKEFLTKIFSLVNSNGFHNFVFYEWKLSGNMCLTKHAIEHLLEALTLSCKLNEFDKISVIPKE